MGRRWVRKPRDVSELEGRKRVSSIQQPKIFWIRPDPHLPHCFEGVKGFARKMSECLEKGKTGGNGGISAE